LSRHQFCSAQGSYACPKSSPFSTSGCRIRRRYYAARKTSPHSISRGSGPLRHVTTYRRQSALLCADSDSRKTQAQLIPEVARNTGGYKQMRKYTRSHLANPPPNSDNGQSHGKVMQTTFARPGDQPSAASTQRVRRFTPNDASSATHRSETPAREIVQVWNSERGGLF